ncbi:SDR family oxidoreductase [Knoellia sp. DB2414S]|uniref:SDR family oxidoreductase n=2 Tax=Knoellia koreensis TaxID=2730921 RepID=A0A849HL45_9MICO|nr:SDR family oxidoreductase [Knoellia sp. DB2414S]NNM48138.1 SDR family oxidoreductase [Knoellia sp. DB2414S]
MARFAGRTALVTGAAHGIGRAIATRLHAEGASVLLADLDVDAATEVADRLGDGRAAARRCDVTAAADVAAMVAACVDAFGALDVLVANVGVASGEGFDGLDDEAWDRQVGPTLRGTIRCVQASMPRLLTSRHGGAVVMTGSVNGLSAFGNVGYSVAKAALPNLAQNLTVEYSAARVGEGQRPVRFNVVAPGTVRTRVWDTQHPDALVPLYPMGRLGEPDDIAAAVAFLASDDAAWVSGVTLPVEGGILAGPALAFQERNPG